MMVRKGPVLAIVHRDGFAMLNVLSCHVAKCDLRLGGKGSVGMEVHGNWRFRWQWVFHEGWGT